LICSVIHLLPWKRCMQIGQPASRKMANIRQARNAAQETPGPVSGR
jgi:hypothetical protein